MDPLPQLELLFFPLPQLELLFLTSFGLSLSLAAKEVVSAWSESDPPPLKVNTSSAQPDSLGLESLDEIFVSVLSVGKEWGRWRRWEGGGRGKGEERDSELIN